MKDDSPPSSRYIQKIIVIYGEATSDSAAVFIIPLILIGMAIAAAIDIGPRVMKEFDRREKLEKLENIGLQRLTEGERKAITAARKEWPSPYGRYFGALSLEVENAVYGAEPLRDVDVFYGKSERGGYGKTADGNHSNGMRVAMNIDKTNSPVTAGGVRDLKSSNGNSLRGQLWASACLAEPECINAVININPEDAKVLIASQRKLADNLIARDPGNALVVCHALGTTYRDLAYYGVPGASLNDAVKAEQLCVGKRGWKEWTPSSIPLTKHVDMAEKAMKAYMAHGGTSR